MDLLFITLSSILALRANPDKSGGVPQDRKKLRDRVAAMNVAHVAKPQSLTRRKRSPVREAGLPGRRLLVKKNIKRLVTLMMFVAVPLVSANPTSALQEVTTTPVITVMQAPAADEKIATERKSPAKFGAASWYSETDAYINLRTANGEIFNDKRMTCASWNYPFNTMLKITNLANGKSVICRVNDRGPAKRLGRIVDLTRSAFARISIPNKGLLTVSVTPLSE